MQIASRRSYTILDLTRRRFEKCNCKSLVGIEPAALRFRCSALTNWATESSCRALDPHAWWSPEPHWLLPQNWNLQAWQEHSPYHISMSIKSWFSLLVSPSSCSMSKTPAMSWVIVVASWPHLNSLSTSMIWSCESWKSEENLYCTKLYGKARGLVS